MTEQPQCADSRPANKQLVGRWFRLGDRVIDFPVEVKRMGGVRWYRRIHPSKGDEE